MSAATLGTVSRLRPSANIACIAWAPGDSRPRALAAAVGGESRTFFDFGIVRKPLIPLRYAASAVRTIAYLAVRRPRAVVIQAPPVPAAALVAAYGRLSGAQIVLDSHTSAFALSGRRVDRAMLPLLRRVARRASACIVTTDEVGRLVEGWGGRPIVVHEPPPDWPAVAAPERDGAGAVLFISTFAPDEPLEEVLAAARELPEVTFRVTGDLRLLDPRLRSAAPPNVEWTGYLRGADYRRALAEADAVLTLDSREQAVARSAYEAVYAERPLVTTNWPHLRQLFPYAVTVDNEATSIAAGVRSALERRTQLEEATPLAFREQSARWQQQLKDLRSALGAGGAMFKNRTET